MSLLGTASVAHSQTPTTGAAAAERLADRYLQILLRRPSMGTALDKVYQYHEAAGSLPDLLQRLAGEETPDAGDGSRAFVAGLLHLKAGAPAKAVVQLRRAEARRPDDAMVSFRLGQALDRSGETAAATAALQRAVDRDPPRLAAAEIFLELGERYLQQDQPQAAETLWQQLSERFPGDWQIGERIARRQAAAGAFPAAAARFDAIAKLARAEGEVEKGVAFAVEAADMRHRGGEADAARQAYQSLLAETRPGSWLHEDIQQRLETLLREDQDPAALLAYYQEQVAQQPENLAVRFRYAQALLQQGQPRQAIDVYRQAIKQTPQNVVARQGLIAALQAAGEIREASEAYEALVEVDPDNGAHRLAWGDLVLRDLSRAPDARRRRAAEIWQQLAKTQPDDPVTSVQVAERLRAIGETEGATAHYRQAIEIAPERSEFREPLGNYLWELNRNSEAIAVWQAIAVGERESLASLSRLAEIYAAADLQTRLVATVARAEAYTPGLSERQQFAILLADADAFAAAVEQLEAAALLADTPLRQDQLLETEIDILLRGGRLPDAIDAAEAAVAENDSEPFALRRLALLQQAAGRLLPALQTIGRAREAAPHDPRVLRTAATIYEEAFQLDEAVATLLKLADQDRPAQFQHLTRAAELQLRLGQVDAALETGQRRIALNPQSAASHEALAELCFAAARDDQALQSLRRALELDPRNAPLRRRLAAALADQYRTDEAIELYWQAYDATDALEAERELISLMTPLHQRLGRFVDLLSRVQQGRPHDSPASSALRVAAAYEATGDVLIALDQLATVAEKLPAESIVWEQLVQLASRAEQIERAVTYQRRLLELAATPEQRRRLLTLALQSPRAGDRQDAVGRLCRAGDEAAVERAIDEALRRGAFELAGELAASWQSQATEAASWDAGLRRAIAACAQGDKTTTAALLGDLRDVLAETHVARSTKTPSIPAADGSAAAASAATDPSAMLTFAPQLADTLGIGNAERCPIVARTERFDLAGLQTRWQRQRALDSLALAHASRGDQLQNVFAKLRTGEEDGSAPTPDRRQRWAALLQAQAYAIFAPAVSSNPAHAEDWRDALWQLVQADDEAAIGSWLIWLRDRQMRREERDDARQALREEPLRESEITWLTESLPHRESATSLATHVAAYEELRWADRLAEAARYVAATRRLVEPQTLAEQLESQDFFLTIGQVSEAIARVPAIREALQRQRRTPVPLLDRLIAQTVRVAGAADAEGRWELLRLLLQAEQQRMRQVPLVPSASDASEALAVYRQRGGQTTLQSVAGPISTRLVRPDFLEAVYELAINATTDTSVPQTMAEKLTTEAAIASLPQEAGQDETSLEQALPQMVAFFLQTWTTDWPAAEATLAALRERFPRLPALQLEWARLLETTGRREAAIEVLTEIRPADPQTLQKRDLRMLRLASYAGHRDVAEAAAQRLSVMPLNTATQLTLVGQLKRMGLDALADAVLQRVQRQAADDSRTLLDVALAYEKQGRPDAAAEAAFDVIRFDRENAAPAGETIRAVRLLHSLDRLDRMIQQMEQRAAAAGEPLPLLRQLSKIYQAAGLQQKMLAIEAKITQREPENAEVQAQLASLYVATHRYGLAVDRFLLAFRIDPQLIAPSWRDFERAVQMSDRDPEVFPALLEIGVERLPAEAIEQLLQLSLTADRSAAAVPWGEAKRTLYRQLLADLEPVALMKSLQRFHERGPQIAAGLAAEPLKKLFASSAPYHADSPIWASVWEIEKGTLHGPLDPWLNLLQKAPELRAELLQAVRERQADQEPGSEQEPGSDQETGRDATSPVVAAVLQAALEWDAGQREAASQRIGDALQHSQAELPPALVGQIAQRWQADGAEEALVAALDEWLLAARLPAGWDSFRDGIPRRVLARLLRNDRHEEARRFLLDGFYGRYPECRFPRVNSAGEAAGLEETTLEEGRFVADQLAALGFTIDALRLQRGLLARLQPERSDMRASSPLARASLTVRKLSDTIDTLSGELIDQAADAVVTERVLDQLLPIDDSASVIDLLVDVPAPWTGRPVASVTSAWLDRIAAQPAGRTMLENSQRKLTDAEVSEGASELRRGMQSWIALALSPAEAAGPLRALAEAVKHADAVPPHGRLQWIALVERSGNVADQKTVAAGQELAWQLLPGAAAAGADNHLLRLAERLLTQPGSDRSDAVLAILRDRLDQQLPARQTPLPVEASRAAFALEVSRLAWQADDPDLALAAADRALAGGTPRVEQASRSEVTGIDLGSGDLERRAHSPERLLAWQAATLAERWQQAVRRAPASELARRIEQTLAGWVFPPGEQGGIAFYLVATTGTPLAFSPEVPRPPSVFVPWLEIALARGQAEALPSRWRGRAAERLERTDALTADLVWSVGTNRADKASQPAEHLAEGLAEQMGVTLPSWAEVEMLEPPAGPLTPTIAKKKAAGQKLQLADRLFLVRPRSRPRGDEDATAERAQVASRQRLVLRTVALLLLDQTASREALPQLEWMTAEIVAHPAEGNDDDVAVTARHLQTLIQKQLAEETP